MSSYLPDINYNQLLNLKDDIKNSGYIYFITHPAYAPDLIKQGRTDNLSKRLSTYKTHQPKPYKYILVFEIIDNDIIYIDKKIKKFFSTLNKREKDGGIEYYDSIILDYIELYLIKCNINYKKLSLYEIEKLAYEKNNFPDMSDYTEEDDESLQYIDDDDFNIYDLYNDNIESIFNSIFVDRAYQNEISNYSGNFIMINKKIYIELATGTGKTYILYKIIYKLQSLNCKINNIIIFSPRRNINLQNTESKYHNLLNIPSKNVFNNDELKGNIFSKFDSFYKNRDINKPNIISACCQSMDNIQKIIIDYNLQNCIVIYDEAHYIIENRIFNGKKIYNENNEFIKFEDEKDNFWFINSDNFIKYRLYLSASPNTEQLKLYVDIIGEHYKLHPIKWFIDNNFLCPIETFILNKKIDEGNNIYSLLDDFKYKETVFGFSFHNCCENAFNLFIKHIKLYMEDETNIKPFICISNEKKYEKELKEIEDKLLELDMYYQFNNINKFKQNENSIAYVVQMYSMGFNFEKLDYIAFTDPKYSYQDIIQCIGRGTRQNPDDDNKILNITLLTYIDDNTFDSSEYTDILKVLDFITMDIGLEYNKVRKCFTSDKAGSKRKNKISNKSTNNYNGDESIDTIEIYKKLRTYKKKYTYNQCKKILEDKNIISKKQYSNIVEKIPHFLPENPEKIFTNFDWFDYLNIDKSKYYDNIEIIKDIVQKELIKKPELRQLISNEIELYNNIFKDDKQAISYDLFNELYNKNIFKLFMDFIIPRKKIKL